MRFKCDSCGAEHDLEEISFGAPEPLQWTMLTDEERARSLLGEEQCEIESKEGRSFYIRACLEIPIRGTGKEFTWGVWCSLSEQSYIEIASHWDDWNRSNIGPHFGWLCTQIPGYPDTALLKTQLHQRKPGIRPRVELEPTPHLLSSDQRFGIEPDRLKVMVMALLHESEKK